MRGTTSLMSLMMTLVNQSGPSSASDRIRQIERFARDGEAPLREAGEGVGSQYIRYGRRQTRGFMHALWGLC